MKSEVLIGEEWSVHWWSLNCQLKKIEMWSVKVWIVFGGDVGRCDVLNWIELALKEEVPSKQANKQSVHAMQSISIEESEIVSLQSSVEEYRFQSSWSVEEIHLKFSFWGSVEEGFDFLGSAESKDGMCWIGMWKMLFGHVRVVHWSGVCYSMEMLEWHWRRRDGYSVGLSCTVQRSTVLRHACLRTLLSSSICHTTAPSRHRLSPFATFHHPRPQQGDWSGRWWKACSERDSLQLDLRQLNGESWHLKSLELLWGSYSGIGSLTTCLGREGRHSSSSFTRYSSSAFRSIPW